MRILAVSNRYLPASSGFEVFFSQMLNTLKRRGHYIEIITLNVLNNEDYYRHTGVLSSSGYVNDIFVSRKKCVSFFGQKRLLGYLEKFAPYYLGYNRLLSPSLIASLIDKIPYFDVVLAGTMPFTQVIHPALIIARLFGKRTAIIPLIHFGPPHHKKFEYEYFSKQCISLYKMADIVITVSDYENEFMLQNGYKGRIVRIEPFVERPDNFIRKENFDLLTVGFHSYEKGIETTLKAFEMFNMKYKDESKLYITGKLSNKYMQIIKRLNNITYNGYVSNEEKNELFKRCSVMILPSIAESYGISTAEAHAYSMPTINAYCSGSMYLVRDGINGFLIPFQDHMMAFERLQMLYNDRSLYRRISHNAYECSADYTEQRHIQQCVRLEEALS